MIFETTPRTRDLAQRIRAFMDENVYPNERRYFDEAETLGPWKTYPIVAAEKTDVHLISKALLPRADDGRRRRAAAAPHMIADDTGCIAATEPAHGGRLVGRASTEAGDFQRLRDAAHRCDHGWRR